MLSCIPEKCILRRSHTVIDIELHAETNTENGSEITAEPSELVHEESSPTTFTGQRQQYSYVEIWLNFFYFIGVTPFRVDFQRNIQSFCISKLVSITIKALAIVYTIFSIRRLTWSLDEEDQTQQDRASSCIGLVNQVCSLLLHVSLLRMVWCKQEEFLRFFKLNDCCDTYESTNPTNFRSSLGTFLVILACIFTIFISLICSVGGLPTLDWIETWSFSDILLYNEDVFLFSLKKYYNHSEHLNYTGVFPHDGEFKTIVIGSTGITMNFCKLIDSFFSHDCLLMCSVSLWMSTKSLRGQLALWKSRSRKNSNYEIACRNLADDMLKKHKELNYLSKQINTITNCFLPVLSMTSMITMSYFLHTCVTRSWFYALYLALKLCKVCLAMGFSLKTSNVAVSYNTWFVSEEVQSVLELSAKEFQRQVTEMNQTPFGIGDGIFYIDMRFLLNALGLVITYYIMMIVG